MASPEILSEEYRYIMAHDVLFPPRLESWGIDQPGASRKELEVPQEEIDRFLTERTLESVDSDQGKLIGTVMFFVQAVVKLRHPADVVSPDNYYLEEGSVEVISGKRLTIHTTYVPVEMRDDVTTFAPLDEISNNGSPITDHTAEVARRTSAGGRFGNDLTRKILPLIDN